MVSVTLKAFVLSVIVLNVVMLSVVAPVLLVKPSIVRYFKGFVNIMMIWDHSHNTSFFKFINRPLFYTRLGKAFQRQHSSLLGPIISYEENEVL